MSQALPSFHTAISGNVAVPRELAEKLRTFAYALMGQGPLAEQIAIEALTNAIRQYGAADSRIIAMERVMLLGRFLSPRNGGFERPADALLRNLTLEQRAVVALRKFLHLPVEERLQVLALSEEQEFALWKSAVQSIVQNGYRP